MLSAPSLVLVDLDDVLCSTTLAASVWHNKQFNSTQLELDDFHYYHWWKNPGWGTPAQTAVKANLFYRSEEFKDIRPINGAREVLQQLRTDSFRFAVLTSREQELRELTDSWLEKWYPGIFETVYFSQDFTKPESKITSQNSGSEAHSERHAGLNKAEMCKRLSASLLIDDALENVWDCVDAGVPALLFGDYEWGKRLSFAKDSKDFLSFEERKEYERNRGTNVKWWIDDGVEISSDGIWKVRDWKQVLEWMEGPGKHIL